MDAFSENSIVAGDGLNQPMRFRDALLGGVAQHLIIERHLPREIAYRDILPAIAEHFPACFRVESSELFLLIKRRPDGGHDFALVADPTQCCRAMVTEPAWQIHDVKRTAQRIAAELAPLVQPSGRA